jgi:hypothetical protein
MTPGEVNGTISQIIDGLEDQRNRMLLMSGTDRTQRPFNLDFDPDVCSYAEMQTILEAVRARFPYWQITGQWKTHR